MLQKYFGFFKKLGAFFTRHSDDDRSLMEKLRDKYRLVIMNADTFETATRSAAMGGTTTVIPFACQQKGGSLRAAVEDYHRRADGKALVDYAFHLIVSDPTTIMARPAIRQNHAAFARTAPAAS